MTLGKENYQFTWEERYASYSARLSTSRLKWPPGNKNHIWAPRGESSDSGGQCWPSAEDRKNWPQARASLWPWLCSRLSVWKPQRGNRLTRRETGSVVLREHEDHGSSTQLHPGNGGFGQEAAETFPSAVSWADEYAGSMSLRRRQKAAQNNWTFQAGCHPTARRARTMLTSLATPGTQASPRPTASTCVSTPKGWDPTGDSVAGCRGRVCETSPGFRREGCSQHRQQPSSPGRLVAGRDLSWTQAVSRAQVFHVFDSRFLTLWFF